MNQITEFDYHGSFSNLLRARVQRPDISRGEREALLPLLKMAEARTKASQKFHDAHVFTLERGSVVLVSPASAQGGQGRVATLRIDSLKKPVRKGLECAHIILDHAAKGLPYPTAAKLLGDGKAVANNLRDRIRDAKGWVKDTGFKEIADGVLGQIHVGRDGVVTYNPTIRVKTRYLL